jgi:hypothetical protein
MGGYIFLRSRAGLCDSLFMLEMITPYAQKDNRTIIFDLVLYGASDLESIFDLSNYPVPILYGSDVISKIDYTKTEPECFSKDVLAFPKQTGPNLFFLNDQLAQFDMTKTYDKSVLLVYHGAMGGFITMNNINFSKKLLENYYAKLTKLPKKFHAVHLRATDHFHQKIEKDLDKIREFIQNKENVYLATDNMKHMKLLSEEFPQIIKSFSYEIINIPYYSLHHHFGKVDPDCLNKAILDILICASAEEFLPSVGGFSRLIGYLHNNKHILKRLTSAVELPRPAE